MNTHVFTKTSAINYVNGRPTIDTNQIKRIEYYERLDQTWIYWADGDVQKFFGCLNVVLKPEAYFVIRT